MKQFLNKRNDERSELISEISKIVEEFNPETAKQILFDNGDSFDSFVGRFHDILNNKDDSWEESILKPLRKLYNGVQETEPEYFQNFRNFLFEVKKQKDNDNFVNAVNYFKRCIDEQNIENKQDYNYDFESHHKDQLFENLLDFTGNKYYIDNPLSLEDFEEFGIKEVKEKTMSLFIEYLKENGHYPSIYQSVLPEEVYKEAKKQNLIIEVFPSMSTLPLDEDPIVYSPVRSDLAVITSEAYTVDFDLEQLEDYLSKSGSKTTKDVQNTIKLILQINNFRLSDELKSHLNFVLEMETID